MNFTKVNSPNFEFRKIGTEKINLSVLSKNIYPTGNSIEDEILQLDYTRYKDVKYFISDVLSSYAEFYEDKYDKNNTDEGNENCILIKDVFKDYEEQSIKPYKRRIFKVNIKNNKINKNKLTQLVGYNVSRETSCIKDSIDVRINIIYTIFLILKRYIGEDFTNSELLKIISCTNNINYIVFDESYNTLYKDIFLTDLYMRNASSKELFGLPSISNLSFIDKEKRNKVERKLVPFKNIKISTFSVTSLIYNTLLEIGLLFEDKSVIEMSKILFNNNYKFTISGNGLSHINSSAESDIPSGIERFYFNTSSSLVDLLKGFSKFCNTINKVKFLDEVTLGVISSTYSTTENSFKEIDIIDNIKTIKDVRGIIDITTKQLRGLPPNINIDDRNIKEDLFLPLIQTVVYSRLLPSDTAFIKIIEAKQNKSYEIFLRNIILRNCV